MSIVWAMSCAAGAPQWERGCLTFKKNSEIKPWIIVAIEKADPKSFDSPWMIGPLVKSYARYLGMDAEEAYARFKAEGDSEAKAADALGRLSKLKMPRQAIRKSSAAANLAVLSDQGFSRFSGSSGNFKLSAGVVLSSVVVAALCAGIIYLGWTVYRGFQTIDIEPYSSQFDAGNSADPQTGWQRRISQDPPKDFIGGIRIAELDPDDQGIFAVSGSGDATGTELAK